MFIIIAGPTGVGKSKIAVELALQLNGEIISADSMQIYKGMDIGTFKIKKEEMKGIKHHMLDIVLPFEKFTVADFKKKTEKLLNNIKNKKKLPIIVGGTGLYIEAIIRGLAELKKTDLKLREKLNRLYKEKGIEFLVNMLKEKDKEAIKIIDIKNPRRVIRTLEIIMSDNIKFSELKQKTEETKYKDDYFLFILNINREELYKRIEERVEKMFDSGLIDEVNKIVKKGVDFNVPSMQAIGYKEILDIFYEKNENINLKEKIERAKEKIKKATKNYAKRQITWFKRYKEAIWIDVTGKSDKQTVDEIIKIIKRQDKK